MSAREPGEPMETLTAAMSPSLRGERSPLTTRLRTVANYVNLAVADSLGREAAERIEALERERDNNLDSITVGNNIISRLRRERQDDEALLRQALEALVESQDTVWNAYTSDWRHCMPTRARQLDAMHQTALAHDAAIAALRERLGETT